MKNLKVSIIIVHYKVKNELFECLKSIYDSGPKVSFEIIVVDNDETKSIEQELKQKFSKVRYVKSEKNLGFGVGNNLGAKSANGEYLFFLNPDTLVENDAIGKLYEFIKANENIGIASPLLVDNGLTPFKTQSRKELTPKNAIYSFSFLRKFFPQKNIYNDSFFKTWDKKKPIKAETIPGAALMIKKKLFEQVGGFDEEFFLYFEENDLSKRVRNLDFKLYINPNSKIIHKVGQSTKKLKNTENIFEKSRFLYFKKHYGFLKAVLTEGFLRINKNVLILLVILLAALFLRTVNLNISMPFIGDQGWFYLSARDLIKNGDIPLVGITSSRIWLHQGPLWTYMLSVALFLGNFNPISGAVLTAIFGLGSVILLYKLGSELFSKNTGLIAAAFYAVSPLAVYFDRMPFDPSPIPFFTIIYFYSIFKWLNGKTIYFPLAIIFLAILYNLELATFSLFFPLLFIFLYGIYRKKFWVKNIFNTKIILYSIIGFIAVMMPIIVYDFANGFKQTIIFLGWVIIYKPLSFLFKSSSGDIISQFAPVAVFLTQSMQKLIFQTNYLIAVLLFSFSFLFLFFDLFKRKISIVNSKFLLLLFLIMSLFGILINKTPADAYLPVIFPFVIFTVAIFFDYLFNLRIKYLVAVGIFILLIFNFYSTYKNTLKPDLAYRIKATDAIIALTKGQEYNLMGKGEGSWFESFTMNYEYLLWWKGYPPSKKDVRLKIIIQEKRSGISIYKI